jgi:cytochrome c2
MGSTVARLEWSRASTTAMQTRAPALPGTGKRSKDYIRDPRAKVPGTKMVFAGIKNDKELDDLWSYLKQFAADGQKK